MKKLSHSVAAWLFCLAPVSCGDVSLGSDVLDAGAAETTASTESAPGIAAPPAVDILFMVDNSPSMYPKQLALATNLPTLLQQLQNLPGGLPDIHIGVVSSDMGAGEEYAGLNCARPLGDKGLLWGNDPNNPTASVAPGSLYATNPSLPAPITDGCGLDSGARWIVDIADPSGSGRLQNYHGRTLTDVLSCLATAVGTDGCGFEHQLQSVRVALHPQDGVNAQNRGFVRANAYLAVVLVTDEDDCSAEVADANNNGMFQEKQNPITETASLRCAARGHVCNGQRIPNYSPQAGYTGTGFTAPFSSCAPKVPSTPAEMPLIGVQEMIDYMVGPEAGIPGFVTDANGYLVTSTNHGSLSYTTVVKPADKIIVAGIIGWPQGSLVGVNYQIGKDLTAEPPEDGYWTYMPICNTSGLKDADGNVVVYKAYGGLRLKKFLDAFPQIDAQGNPVANTFSICNADFSNAMLQIGGTIVNKLATD